MQPIYVLSLAAQHERWATVRQAAITSNVANANTPGYVAVDVEPFSAVLNQTANLTMARTAAHHLNGSGEVDSGDARTWQARETGEAVALDRQLVLADETNRAFSLDTGIVRAFHRMLMTAVRSGV